MRTPTSETLQKDGRATSVVLFLHLVGVAPALLRTRWLPDLGAIGEINPCFKSLVKSTFVMAIVC